MIGIKPRHIRLQKSVFLCLIFVSVLLLPSAEAAGFTTEKKRLETTLQAIRTYPPGILKRIADNKSEFLKDLKDTLSSEKENILIFVDKTHILDKNYKPKKIIMLSDLKGRAYRLDRRDIPLAEIAEPPLQTMAAAAAKDGIKLTVSSGYREYTYQENLFNYYVSTYGAAKANTFSAPPGSSQHQLGTAIDFGTLDDAYAKTPEGKWLLKNAYKYGWSLSYPNGYEKVTGYKWECWHYRYIGEKACRFQKKWFGDIQHYTLNFISEWKKTEVKP